MKKTKVNLHMMNKGGVAKTPYTIFTMLKLLKSENKDFKIIDMDSNNHSLYNRFVETKYQKYIAGITLLSGDEDSNIDYGLFEQFFKDISATDKKEYYIDLGQSDSKGFQNLVRNYGSTSVQQGMVDMNIDLTIVPIVKIDDLDSLKIVNQYVQDFQGFKISIAVNMLDDPKRNHPNIEKIITLANANGIDLNFYNNSKVSKSGEDVIHNHLVSGLQTNLGMLSGAFETFVDQIVIP